MFKKESKIKKKIEYYKAVGETISFERVLNLEAKVNIIFYSAIRVFSLYRSLLIFLLIIAIYAPMVGRESSMEPTIRNNDITFVKRGVKTVERGDLVVFTLPDGEDIYLKRVIGLPGETVEIKNGKVYIDSVLLEEDYVKGKTVPFMRSGAEKIVVPEGEYYMLGDNREESEDSRYFGTIKKENMIGKIAIKLPTSVFLENIGFNLKIEKEKYYLEE